MTRSSRSAVLRSTALATSLALVVGLSGFGADAWAKPNVPLPKARPIARSVVLHASTKSTAPLVAASVKLTPATMAPAGRPPILAPATRLHAALPLARKPSPAAIAATSSTSQADSSALENVIELVRKHKPAEATQAQATIADPVARKLAEWIILRSDDNGASVERYGAFIAANPSWPSQSFLRRRMEAALWDDHRDDVTVWAWFQNESPRSAKGKFALSRVMLARGDRANAERLVREAWRNDPMSEDAESAALDAFGALLTPGDQKARMDLFLYGSDHDAALRAAKRLGAAQVVLAKARIAAFRKAPNTKALLDAVPHEL
ncbi:MAG TPA: lytic transglycosylase domain-containing protein, partial [Bradyrhizobium sp.]|nr:lytic transglycosylase domain-containing protein [Bradyrhizobium sp.]